MAVVEVSIVPLGTQTASVSTYVKAAHAALSGHPGVKAVLTPMGTVLEGDLDACLAAVRAAHEAPFGLNVQRVYTVLKIDDRRDKVGSIEQKLAAIREDK